MVEKVTKTDLEALEKRLKLSLTEYVREYSTSMMDIQEKSFKMQIKSLFSALESQNAAISLMEKQFNMKIGGIKGNMGKEDKKSKQDDEDILAEFDSYEQFEAWVEAQRLKDKNKLTEFEPHPLTEK